MFLVLTVFSTKLFKSFLKACLSFCELFLSQVFPKGDVRQKRYVSARSAPARPLDVGAISKDEVLKGDVCFYSYPEKRLPSWKSYVSAIFLARRFLPSGQVLGCKPQLPDAAAEGIAPWVSPPSTRSANLWGMPVLVQYCILL